LSNEKRKLILMLFPYVKILRKGAAIEVSYMDDRWVLRKSHWY
jgi:hypothetical protein